MYGLNIDLLNPAGRPSPDELRALGVRTVRFTYKDASGGDQPDAGRVGYYGNIGRAYAEAGIRSLVILTNETYPGFPNVFPAQDAVWDAYLTPFVRRARQLAEAFGPWQPALQVWNEPDLPPSPGYIPTMTEQQYARLLGKTYEAIKAANPSLKVVAAGLASGQPWWLKNVIRAGGGTLPADAVAIHPYEQRPARNWPTADYGFGYVGDLLNRYRQVTSLPLTITECGERLLGEDGQAGYLRRFYNTMLTDFAEVVDNVYWFCYSDGMVPPFGLLTAAGQQKPAYATYQTVATQPPPPAAGQADTIVTRLTTNQSSIIEGSAVTFEATVQNIGESVTGDTVGVAFLIDGQYITFATTNPLGPGERQTLRSVSTWTATAGDHTLTAVVDDINRYPEASEDNNSLNLAVRVRPAQPALSDVLVRDITFAEDSAGRVRLAARIANEGGSPTGDIVGVAFFVDDHYVTFGTTPPIAPGQVVTVQAVQLLRLTGSHKITALVDDVNRFPERNEQNNSRTEQISFGDDPPALADTTVVSVTAGSGRLSGGDQVTFEAVVQNIGGGPTGDIVGVAFLVDGQYITFGSTSPIPAGESRLVRAVSAWKATPGKHSLTAVVDDINRYPEISESNNQLEQSFEVFLRDQVSLPDSTVTDLGFETNNQGHIILTATVANVGTAPTPDLVGVAFFVDGLYRTYGITQPMAVNANEVLRAVQPLPLQGRHTIMAIVDDVNRYDEISHQNNVLVRDMTFR